MDAKGFRLADKTSLFKLNQSNIANQVNIEIKASGSSIPADDSRYPAYAATMSDARTFTDYRSHCASRVPALYTKPVKEWIIKNGSQIIEMNRKRQTENTGAVFGTANTVLPPEILVFCDPYGCEQQLTNEQNGTGIEIVNECPELPGSFMYRPDPSVMSANTKKINYNLVNENGRNSSRRWETGVYSKYS